MRLDAERRNDLQMEKGPANHPIKLMHFLK